MRRKSELWVVYLFLGLVALVYGLVLLLGPMASPGWAAPLRQGLPDVAVEKYKDSGVFAPGHYVNYVISYQNESLYPATDIFIRDTLPISTTYVSSSGPGLTPVQLGPDRVVWHKDRLTDFERGWASITVRVEDDAPVGAWVSNIVRISTEDPEGNFDNNEYIFWEEVLAPGPADLTVTKKLYSGTVGPGNEITYQIIYHNRGAETANNVRITDTLPISTTYVSDDTSKSGGFTTAMVGSTVVWTRSSVPAFAWGSSCQRPSCYYRTDLCNELYLKVRISDDFDPNTDWLENVVEISTTDLEADYDNNLNRLTIKPEAHRLYGAAVTSVDDKTMRLLNDGGFDWMIYYLDWSETEPQDDQYYWRDLDSAAWQAWWYNLKLIVRVDRAPAWARGPGTATAPPANPDKLREFLQEVTSGRRFVNGRWSYVPKIAGYVIWNEPNLALEWGGNAPDAAAYTALLQAAYNGVKAGDPSALVISAGLAPTNDNSAMAVDDRLYLQAMLDNGACNYFDRLGVNPMGFTSGPDDTSDPNGYNFSRALEWRQILVANGCSKDMFATEMGWLRDTDIDLGSYNWMKVSDIDQAHYLARAYHKARREWPWMGPMMTWNLDFAAFYSDTEHFYWFSVTDDDLSGLRAYLTLQNAATGGPADLWVEKELISPVTPGGDLVYLIHYTNIGGQPATGVFLTDTMPIGTIYVTDTRGGASVTDGQVVWDIGTIDTGAREAITLTLRMTGDGLPGGILTNTVEASAVAGEPYTDDNVATVSTPIPDLSIRKSVVPNAAAPEDTITYTLVFSNAGQDTARGVGITDIVPVSVTVQSVISSGVTITDTGASPPYVWEVQHLAPGQGGVITITGVLSPGLPIGHVFTNTATITGTTIDNAAGNNTAEAGVTIIVPVLSINKTVTPATEVTYHGEVTYTVALDNSGTAADVGDVLFTDTLPGEVDFSRWVEQPGEASVVNDEITWSGTVTAGEAITFTFVVSHVGAYGDVVTNTAEYSHASGSGDDDAQFTVESAPAGGESFLPLVWKGFGYAPDLVVDSLVATSSAVTVTVRNQGNAPVTDAFWVDVYFNPTKTPALNEPWDTIASHGMVWGITTAIPAGGSLILVNNTSDPYYFPEYSSAPPLPVGATAYALVDSVDYSTTYGVVQESNEGNNLYGPVVSVASAAGGAPPATQSQPASREGLPPR